MESGSSKLDLLREEILSGTLNRRAVLKRAMLMGLSAPVIAGLLAACGGDDDDDDGGETEAATSTTGGNTGQATTAAGEATATTAEGGDEEASPTTGTSTGSGSTGETPGKGRGVADLLKVLYWQAPTILNTHFSQGTKDS